MPPPQRGVVVGAVAGGEAEEHADEEVLEGGLAGLVGAGDDREPAGQVRDAEVVVDPVAVDVEAVDLHASTAVIGVERGLLGGGPDGVAVAVGQEVGQVAGDVGGEQRRSTRRRSVGPASSMERRRSAVKSSRRRRSTTSTWARVRQVSWCHQTKGERAAPRRRRSSRISARRAADASSWWSGPAPSMVARTMSDAAAVPGRVGEAARAGRAASRGPGTARWTASRSVKRTRSSGTKIGSAATPSVTVTSTAPFGAALGGLGAAALEVAGVDDPRLAVVQDAAAVDVAERPVLVAAAAQVVDRAGAVVRVAGAGAADVGVEQADVERPRRRPPGSGGSGSRWWRTRRSWCRGPRPLRRRP